MPIKKSQGQMYPWVDAMHTHLGGECSHQCKYCYVDNPRFGRAPRYTGDPRLIEAEFSFAYDEKTLKKICGKYPATIFVEHMNDLFAADVPNDFIIRILLHCCTYPENTYVFQSKNTHRLFMMHPFLPPNRIVGTTAESNVDYPDITKAPAVMDRLHWLGLLVEEKKFVTIEPVLDFDPVILAKMIGTINPWFVNLGADSKGHDLPEPSIEKIEALVEEFKKYKVELREKHNLDRLRRRQNA